MQIFAPLLHAGLQLVPLGKCILPFLLLADTQKAMGHCFVHGNSYGCGMYNPIIKG